jgi:multidrug efflux system membrane fusion protein
MRESELTTILRRIRRMTAEVGGASDAELLDRFAAHRDEAAFELLLWRHARLVFGVCRRVLHNTHDAGDAFQATFLTLARHARRITKRQAVAAWLFKVAYRVALTARDRRARRGAREKSLGGAAHTLASADADASAENQELRHVLDQEIGRLPERFRAAVVLCYLEGKTVDEAAVLLGCPRGTVASRLARARERLRLRLAGRGLALPVALALASRADAASGPFSLIPNLTTAALRYTARGGTADGTLAPRITALTEEVLRAMFLHKLKTGIVILIALVGLLLAGGGLAVGPRANDGPEAEPPKTGDIPKAQAAAGAKDAEAPRTVSVSRPVRREAAPYQVYTGRLEARRSVEVRPEVSGIVLKVCFKAGDEVKQGDMLFELDSRAAQLNVDKTKAQLALVEAKKKQSDIERKNANKLREQNVISSDEFDIKSSQVAAAEAAVKLAQIELDRARLELEATKVRAPMSGRVGRSLVEEGTRVFHGQDRATLLTTVTSLDPIGLTFNMDERSYLRYQRLLRENKVKGAGSSLRIQLSDAKDFPHEGALESFEDQFNPNNGTMRIRGSIPNPGRLLLPGMSVLVRMTVGPPRAVLEVPDEAILSDQGKSYVLVVNDGNVVQRREVSVGQADNGMRIIEKGLRAEDWVVITGLTDIHPGDSVKPRRQAMPVDKSPVQKK